MAGLPINIPIPAESAVASYSWTDIADGTGNVELDGFLTTSSTTTNYFLKTNPLETSSVYFGLANGDVTTEFYLGAFNTPRVLKGSCYVYLLLMGRGGDFSGAAVTLYATLSLWKKSGGVSTQIGSSVITPTLSVGRNVWGLTATNNFITASQTNFKIGDEIYLRIVSTATGITSTSRCGIYADPRNRTARDPWGVSSDTTGKSTYLKLSLPFKVDL
jgi:hypothetical protein